MATKAVGQLHTLRIKLGGPADGVPAWDVAWTTLLGKRRTNVDNSVDGVEVTALEDIRKFRQPTYKDGKVDFDILVTLGGRTFADAEGSYIQVEYLPTPTADPEVYTGYIESVTTGAGNDAQIETIRIQQGANGAGN